MVSPARFRRGTVARRGVARTGGAEARYLGDRARTRSGVAGFGKPEKIVTDVTIALVVMGGEWTRRVVGECGARRGRSGADRPHRTIAPGSREPAAARYSAAMSSSTAMSVRTGTPVPPLPM